MLAEGIEYSYLKKTGQTGKFDEIIDYFLKVPCVNRDDVLDYIFRLYRYGPNLYITDMFPKMYENDPNCFKRFTSHDGFSINMRRLSVCCLRIFVEHFIKNDVDSVLVISGSYAPLEEEHGPSRKLRLYWHFFEPLLEECNLRAIMMTEWNAFLLVSNDTLLDETLLKDTYIKFKNLS